MAGKKREDIRDEDITGLKWFDKLLPLFDRLHEVGCQRDKAGNRQLYFDQYCSLLLLFLFNPTVSSLRALQQASELKKVQRKLRCGRASLGSLSEATEVFEPELLKEIIKELGDKVQPVQNVGRGHVKHLLTAVDGSVVKTLATISEAAYLKNCHGQSKSAWRLHTHFDIDHHVPRRIDVTRGLNSGKSDEKNVLRNALQPDHCYVQDRWYADFQLFNDIHAIGSSYVCRIRDNSRYKILEERPLSEKARKAAAAQHMEFSTLLDSAIEKAINESLYRGFRKALLGDVISISAKLVDPTLPEMKNLPHVSAENIVSVTGAFVNLKSVAEDGMKSNKYFFDSGDVLYSKLRPYLRKVALSEFCGLCSADMYPLKVNPDHIESEFLKIG